MRFTEDLKARVAKAQKKIVLPETSSPRVLKAAERVLAEGFARIVLVGKLEQIKKDAAKYQIDLTGVEVIDPATYYRMDELCAYFAKRREKKGMTPEKAYEVMVNNYTFFAAGLVALGEADGVVSGAITTSADVIRAGLQVVGPRPGNKTVSSAFILLTNTPQYGDNGILVLGDCGVIPDPTAEQLADIACICVERAERTVQMLRPRVAFLSYSTMQRRRRFRRQSSSGCTDPERPRRRIRLRRRNAGRRRVGTGSWRTQSSGLQGCRSCQRPHFPEPRCC